MPENLIGKELLGQFRIMERIGRGGMGEVFKAEQPAMDRLVAIKILHAKLASRKDLVSRFRREARAMSRLSHPNTARVFLYGQLEESEQLYIVMEYLKGVDLARLVRRDGPMEVKRATKVMIQVLGALEEAHSVGVIHRDLKPENILLTTQGGIEDFPKVLDFGLAKVRETRLRPGSMVLTQEGMVFGTPEFMSPEQARGETLDPKSDIYSIGLIYYELLTGRLPFPKCKPMEYISHHIYTKPIPVTERVPDLKLPGTLDPIISRALEKDKADRYQSAQEFALALQKVLPRSISRDHLRAIPRAPANTVKGARFGHGGVDDKQSSLGGKKLIVIMMAVIFLLVGLVVWLLVTRPGESGISTIPIQNIAPVAEPTGSTPVPPNPGGAGD
jgi:serine/threonine-protein kinase